MNNDLISRSALLENYGLKNAVKYGNKTAEQQHNSYSTLMLYEIADMINDAPAVDAEVVRHGYWIPQDGTRTKFMCSDCKSRNHDGSGRYCSLCGCKMDGEHNDIQRV